MSALTRSSMCVCSCTICTIAVVVQKRSRRMLLEHVSSEMVSLVLPWQLRHTHTEVSSLISFCSPHLPHAPPFWSCPQAFFPPFTWLAHFSPPSSSTTFPLFLEMPPSPSCIEPLFLFAQHQSSFMHFYFDFSLIVLISVCCLSCSRFLL